MEFLKSCASKRLWVFLALVVLGVFAIVQVNITAVSIAYIVSEAFVKALKIWKAK